MQKWVTDQIHRESQVGEELHLPFVGQSAYETSIPERGHLSVSPPINIDTVVINDGDGIILGVNPTQEGLAATFDLATFGLYMIAPVKKSANHSKNLRSMCEVQGSRARITRECFLFVVTRFWKRNSFFVTAHLLLAFFATVQCSNTTFSLNSDLCTLLLCIMSGT